ncbi:hypothetical protein GCM10011575_31290 [Microlunatus endophyticus]|uniref:Uncharacterized protein n=2 Tax=Microlunatus endophyticus TaxID=1716077 RepID=A0A917SDD0_9ACTN|nr:hypothetical protein GCM10011575_31290 [Microlunatus endophyticus]
MNKGDQMPNTTHTSDQPITSTPDLPLVIELLQNQLDDLTATVRAQQAELTRQATRIADLERT